MRISDWSSDVCSSDLLDLEMILKRNEHSHNVPDQVSSGFGNAVQKKRLWQPSMRKLLVLLIERIGAKPDPGHCGYLVMAVLGEDRTREIGRASCRERVCQYV